MQSERIEWARLTATARSKVTTLEGLPKVTRDYWQGRAEYTATEKRPDFSREKCDPQAIADRRAKAEARRLEARVGVSRIDAFGESIGGDLEPQDLAWVDASGVSHDLPSIAPPETPAPKPTPSKRLVGKPRGASAIMRTAGAPAGSQLASLREVAITLLNTARSVRRLVRRPDSGVTHAQAEQAEAAARGAVDRLEEALRKQGLSRPARSQEDRTTRRLKAGESEVRRVID